MIKILLPTDFSKNSWNAISYACQLFKDEKCTLVLLNTYKSIPYSDKLVAPNRSVTGSMDEIKDASINGLEKISQRIENEFNNSKHMISQVSSLNGLTGEIDEIHEQYGIDFIVMGTKGATGAEKTLFGSNTVDVFNVLKCPVIAVPQDFDFAIPKEISFFTDYNVLFEESQLQPIIDIASQYESTVNIIHVNDKKLSYDQVDIRNKLEKLFKSTSCALPTEKNKSVPEAIEEYRKEGEVNFLAMINNQHSFFENLFFKNKINQIGFQLSIPFLVIPSISK